MRPLLSALSLSRWKCVGEKLVAMYRHQTTCEPPRPSLGRRINLSEYQDLERCLQRSPPPCEAPAAAPGPALAQPPTPVSEPQGLSQQGLSQQGSCSPSSSQLSMAEQPAAPGAQGTQAAQGGEQAQSQPQTQTQPQTQPQPQPQAEGQTQAPAQTQSEPPPLTLQPTNPALIPQSQNTVEINTTAPVGQ